MDVCMLLWLKVTPTSDVHAVVSEAIACCMQGMTCWAVCQHGTGVADVELCFFRLLDVQRQAMVSLLGLEWEYVCMHHVWMHVGGEAACMSVVRLHIYMHALTFVVESLAVYMHLGLWLGG
jgi:hypothetical protein